MLFNNDTSLYKTRTICGSNPPLHFAGAEVAEPNHIKQIQEPNKTNNAFADDDDECNKNGFFQQIANNKSITNSMQRMNTGLNGVPFRDQNHNGTIRNTTHRQGQKQSLCNKSYTNSDDNYVRSKKRTEKKFNEKSDKIEKNIKPFNCSHCGKQFKHKHNLQNHIKVHFETAPKCPECGKQFSRKSNLKQHLLIHSDIKPFKCDYCERAFRQKHVLSAKEYVI